MKRILLTALAAALLACGVDNPNPPAPNGSTMSNVIHLTTPAFPALKAQPKPVLIDFWAPWCGPCRQQGPILDQVSLKVGGGAIVAKVNVDEEQALAAQFGVQAIPTLVVLKDGRILQRFVGVQGEAALVGALQSASN